MITRPRALLALASLAFVAAFSNAAFAQQRADDTKENPRPRVVLRAQPNVGMTPARIVLTAELIGGANDYEEYYCPSIEWEWGDDTKSESTVDCEPYEADKSEIRRRFTVQHVFRQSGSTKVYFRMKRRNKEVAVAYVTIQIRQGAGPQEEP